MGSTATARPPKASRAPVCIRRGGHTYHAELRLQLNLQTLECTPQVRDLALTGLELLRMRSNLPVQLLSLKTGRGGVRTEADPWVGDIKPSLLATPPLKGHLFLSLLTRLVNQASASFRFFSAMTSYWLLMSLRTLARSMPGVESTSTLTWPPTWLLRALISWKYTAEVGMSGRRAYWAWPRSLLHPQSRLVFRYNPRSQHWGGHWVITIPC